MDPRSVMLTADFIFPTVKNRLSGSAAMLYVIAAPEMLVAAASDVAGIGSSISTATAAAAGSTTGVAAAAGDEVSAAIASLFSSHAQQFQALGAQAAGFHTEFAQALTAGAGSYAGA